MFVKATLLATVALATSSPAPICGNTQGWTTIDSAVVRGTVNVNTTSYLGIRYAQPPVGNLRFAQAVPLAGTYTGLIDATVAGNACIQSTNGGTNSPSISVQSEDCLNLNVYAPAGARAGSNLPVVVFIYGGSFTDGYANFDIYNGNYALARDKNVVIVTLNYRMGALGFMAGALLNAEGSLNVGLRDQHTALNWVTKYISQFGGSPSQVTLMGQSAGAIAVSHHLLAQSGNQTNFQRAVILSGGPDILPQTYATFDPVFESFASKLGCNVTATALACVRAVSDPQAVYKAGQGVQYDVVYDGTYVNYLTLLDVFAYKAISKVPVLLTTNRDEGTIFGLFDGITSEPIAQYAMANLLPGVFNATEIGHILSYYNASLYPNSAPYWQFGDFFSDLVFQCPTQILAQLYTSLNQTTYVGRKNYVNQINGYSFLGAPIGVYHGSEVPFVFLWTPGFTAAETAYANQIHDYYFNFIRTGNPNSVGGYLPQWPTYGAAQNRFDLGNRTVTPDTDRSLKCDFFKCVILSLYGATAYDASDCLKISLN